jgi:hypothetical protein
MEAWDYETAAVYEHRFWLQILGDHTRFIHQALSPGEQEEIHRASCFIHAWDQLLQLARGEMGNTLLEYLNQEAFQKAEELRAFKLHLLKRQLTGSVGLNLPPAFINHMVNEVEEALSIFSHLLRKQSPPLGNPLHLHLLWLQDAVGHAGSIHDGLDLTELKLKMLSHDFMKQFEQYYLKAVEFAGFLRTNLGRYPALNRFNKEIELEMALFVEFLRELKEMRITHETLGTLTPLMADHMAREELYYLTKLSLVTEGVRPSGDPASPRVEV